MGEIIGSKVRADGKVIFNVFLSKEEALYLRGHIDKIRIFTEHAIDYEANLSERGRSGSTKYFLVPSALRKDLFIRNKVACQRLDSPMTTIFIYMIDKLQI